MRIALSVNGRPVAVEAQPDRRLIDILRGELGVIGPKNGCAVGRCGACLVLLDDRPVNACLVLAARLEGCHVVTIEGLDPASTAVVDALAGAGAVQCGYCASGLVTALTWLTAQTPQPSRSEAEALLAGQICRCTGYGGLRRALAMLFGEDR